MTEQKIAYEPHPVSAERKAELRAQGYTILDARFAPADVAPAVVEQPEAARPSRTLSIKKPEA